VNEIVRRPLLRIQCGAAATTCRRSEARHAASAIGLRRRSRLASGSEQPRLRKTRRLPCRCRELELPRPPPPPRAAITRPCAWVRSATELRPRDPSLIRNGIRHPRRRRHRATAASVAARGSGAVLRGTRRSQVKVRTMTTSPPRPPSPPRPAAGNVLLAAEARPPSPRGLPAQGAHDVEHESVSTDRRRRLDEAPEPTRSPAGRRPR
jgi:hypothetical protein